eukprot:maker-scaffold552_size138156-snap-gene-0.25 protein:Tk00648 transcript:maker-scaffold552_size138156-snap-gene-0.25-mRNA-1 annotation:"PREDICTED: uncharacterized protein CG3556-like"
MDVIVTSMQELALVVAKISVLIVLPIELARRFAHWFPHLNMDVPRSWQLALVVWLVVLPVFLAESSVRQTLDQTIEFTLSQRDSINLSWKAKEAPSAFLGISSADPTWRLRGTSMKSSEQRTEVVSAVQSVQLAFLKLVSGGGGLENIDHSLLAQFVGAFQLACLDIEDIYGHNLVEEMIKRLHRQLPISVSLGPLVLGLCNHGSTVPLRSINFLKHFIHEKAEKRRDYQLYELERASLNLMALKCLKDDSRYQSSEEKASIEEAHQSNLGFIQSLDLSRDGYGTLYKNSLALQAMGHGGPNEAFLRNHLIAQQKPDGSFGGSVVLTAVVIPAISNFSAHDIKQAPCDKASDADDLSTDRDFASIHFEITENVISKQTVVGRILAKPGGNLDEAFQAYQRENPLVLDYESEATPFGRVITRINGIEKRDNLQWTIFEVDPKTGRETRVAKGLDTIQYEHGDTFHIKYDLGGLVLGQRSGTQDNCWIGSLPD